MIEDALHTLLTGDADLAVLVSTRIGYWQLPDESATPYVVYFEVTPDAPLEAIGMRSSQWQISCWADTPQGAKTVARAVRSLLHTYIGVVGSTTIKAATELQTDLYQDPDTELWNAPVDVRMTHTE